MVYVLLGGRTTLLGGFVGAVVIGYLTSYLAEVVPFGATPGDVGPWGAFAMEATRRIVREAPLLVQGAVLVGIVLVLEDGVTPPLFRLLKRHRRWAWWLFLPAVIFVAAIPLLGMHVASAIYIFAVLVPQHHVSVARALVIAGVTAVSLYVMFDWAFQVTLPRGLLGAALGF